MRKLEILISGAGIAGPALAHMLVRSHHRPTIVERAPALRTGGYMIDFWGIGYDVAERMKLLPALEQDAYRIEEVRIVNARGRRVAGFDARIFSAATRGRFFSILRSDLARRIYESVQRDVESNFGDSITSINETRAGVEVTFEHAPPRRFDLVVGADGLHSNVRHHAFGRQVTPPLFLGYAVAAFIAADYPHREEHVYVSCSVPGGQIARYALRDGSTAFFFINAADADTLRLHDPAAQKQWLHAQFAGAGWEAPEILRALDRADELYFDAVAQMRLEKWHAGRTVLVGDAAYCPSLLAGQGSGFALAGAYVLAWALRQHEADFEAAFDLYQARLKPFIDDKQRAARNFAKWFAPRTGFGIHIRNAFTNLLSVPWLGELILTRSLQDRFRLPPLEERAGSKTS